MEILLARPFRSLLTGQVELLLLARESSGIHWLLDVLADEQGVQAPTPAQGIKSGPHDLYGALDAFDLGVAIRQGLCSEHPDLLERYRLPLAQLLGPQTAPPLGRDAGGALLAPPDRRIEQSLITRDPGQIAEILPASAQDAGWLVAIPGGAARWHGKLPSSLDALRYARNAPWARLARERGTLIVEVRLEADGTVWLIDLVRMGRFGPERPFAERRLALSELASDLAPGPITIPMALDTSSVYVCEELIIRDLAAPYDPRDPRAVRLLV